ncbi:MAG: DUF2752 domain-containing protein [Acidimicrobiales bacterium]
MLTNPTDSDSEATRPPPPEMNRVRRFNPNVVIAGGLAISACIGVAVFDPNETQIFPACAFKATTGLDCPGCGMTRALHSLVHGDVLKAISHNLLLVILLSSAIVWFGWNVIARKVGKRELRFKFRRPAWIAIGIGVTAFWVLRNLPWAPFNWLGSGN